MNNGKDWTIMVYMAGDNNLSADMARAIQSLKDQAEIGSNVNLLVYFDGSAPDVPTVYCDLSTDAPEVFHVSADVSPKLYASDEGVKENSANAGAVVNFVDWCVNRVTYLDGGRIVRGRKADRYALIFSGHSAGFHDLGLMTDDSAKGSLTIPRMAWALERITQTGPELSVAVDEEKALRRRRNWAELRPSEIARDTEVVLGQKLSILGFDSCLMGMLEVAQEFAPCAETMIASEGRTPNAGWSYARLLGNLASANGKQATAAIAENFVLDFVRSQSALGLGGVSVDLSAIDLNALGALDREFSRLASHLLQVIQDDGVAANRMLRDAIVQAHWRCQSYFSEQNVDLADFCRELRTEVRSKSDETGTEPIPALAKIVELCRSTEKAVRDAVIISGFSGGEYQYSNGIAVFFPWSAESYRAARPSFETLRFVRKTASGREWKNFLEFYLETFTRRIGRRATDARLEPAFYAGQAPAYQTRIPINPAFRSSSGNLAPMSQDAPETRVPTNPYFRGGLRYERVLSGPEKFRNVESPWNITGFTRRGNPAESDSTDAGGDGPPATSKMPD